LAKYYIILVEWVSELGLYKKYEFLPFMLLWENRHWESAQNTASSAWNDVCNQDWTLSHHLMKICAGQCWKTPSPQHFRSAKYCHVCFQRCHQNLSLKDHGQRVSRGCMKPSCPIADITLSWLASRPCMEGLEGNGSFPETVSWS